MNRKVSVFYSLGISIALIAGVIWLLNYLHTAPWGYHNYRHAPWHVSMMGGGAMGLIMIIFWVMVAAAVVLLVSGTAAKDRSPDPNAGLNARQILDQRYARGEIDRQQYEVMKHDLRSLPQKNT